MAAPSDPAIHQDVHFLARDYAAFRALMLDDLAANSRDAVAQHPANIDVALVEVLAYVADYLSYYQDAVATEAYLETARRRISVRRHARLLGYPLNEGCNARTWVHLETAADGVVVPAGTALATQIPTLDAIRISRDEAATATMFETMHAVTLVKGHNRLRTAAPAAVLRPGEDRLDLAGRRPALAAGDVLVLEHVASWAHPVRLTEVVVGDGTTRVVWHGDDRLPADTPARSGWSLLGNIVLADHGAWLAPEPVELVADGRGDVAIDCSDLCFAAPYRHDEATLDSALAARRQEPRRAEPAMTLERARPRSAGPRAPRWTARRDILRATAFDRVFAVEPIDAARASLRFGDGVSGRRAPNGPMAMRHRQGCGCAGNIGARTLTHIVSDDDRILAVCNPLAATGGTDPETIEQTAALAPYAHTERLRCVTDKDFETAARRLSDVEAVRVHRPTPPAAAVVELHVVRRSGAVVDADFTARLTRAFAPVLLIGETVRVVPAPVLKPDIGIMLPVARSELAAAASAVRDRLIHAVTPGFGIALEIAMIEQAARAVRQGKGAHVVALALAGDGDLAAIRPQPHEVVRVDPDRLTFVAGRQP
ncbi:baseplate J/gp47 family protein [Sphingomonas bacterium]|uniref:baseplate J/gp47 family protein n=1 Tax=Sphingomonas bacterium TaxID=1895847 RepID=UPI00260787E0|nr:baseplate J/gp47 family protein [Sphingomonas bacterium]MDB5678830.1 hypothetical protein [Sphingomonas bacterium]